MENTPPPPVPEPAATTVSEDRTVAILSYLTLIGFIVALVLHSNKKTAIGAYHLRQTLGLMITSIAIMLAGAVVGMIPVLGLLAIGVAWIGIFVAWLLGLIAAATGQMKPIPVVGESFQKWFANAFA